jgi:hypothetical protein
MKNYIRIVKNQLYVMIFVLLKIYFTERRTGIQSTSNEVKKKSKLDCEMKIETTNF